MELSQEQKNAVFAESKNALCLAGAGSGKTRVLVSRVQNLIENHKVSPYEILCATFTRKAGGEMIERLETAIGNKAYNVTIGTLHSVALKMIQRFGEFIGLNPGKITIYSSWEESVLLKDVCVELGYHTGKQFKKGVTKKDVAAAFHLFYTRKVRNDRNYIPNEIMDAFFLRCRENNALTYGMIMTEFLDLIPRIGHMLKYRHVLIDEVQDLDPIQWRIVRLICSICDASLFAVGDDSQSIYSFRGADPGYIIRNQDKFDTYKLKDNYRSDAYIVNAANRLIQNNKNRLDLEMNAMRLGRKPVTVFEDQDSSELVENIKLIPKAHEGNLCVLARNHYLLEKLSSLLSDSGIDHEYIGKTTTFTRSENFRRVHAFLTLAVNPFDNFSFLLCKEHFEIDIPTYKEIRMKAVKEDKSHFQVWCEQYAYLPEYLMKYIDAVKNDDFESVVKWLYGLSFEFDQQQVFEFIWNYIETNHQPKMRDYLDWLALFDVQDEIHGDPKKLQLMTIHASKGLEWSMVIISGMNEGILPSFRSMNIPDELESERRLAYVAFTRARDHLILTSRPIDPDAKVPQPPSRFIKEST